MENEVSGIAKLGIVLIALAVLIGLGFGIFQISKSTANDGVNDVQAELDGVSTSQFTTYDQTTITGTMVNSAVSDFEGENTAVLIATQAWINLLNDFNTSDDTGGGATIGYDNGSGINASYVEATDTEGTGLPVVWAFADREYTNPYLMNASVADAAGDFGTNGSFVNYNAVLGNMQEDAAGVNSEEQVVINSTAVYMAQIYFDNNCFRCVSGFATDDSGRVLFNNIIGNLNKTGRTEYVPSGGKFNSFLVKDASGTTVGVAFQQINNG